MRNQLAEIEHKFRNRFPHNKTQTIYFRFERTPKAEIRTPFTESTERYNKIKNNINRDRLETAFSKYLEK